MPITRLVQCRICHKKCTFLCGCVQAIDLTTACCTSKRMIFDGLCLTCTQNWCEHDWEEYNSRNPNMKRCV